MWSSMCYKWTGCGHFQLATLKCTCNVFILSKDTKVTSYRSGWRKAFTLRGFIGFSRNGRVWYRVHSESKGYPFPYAHSPAFWELCYEVLGDFWIKVGKAKWLFKIGWVSALKLALWWPYNWQTIATATKQNLSYIHMTIDFRELT